MASCRFPVELEMKWSTFVAPNSELTSFAKLNVSMPCWTTLSQHASTSKMSAACRFIALNTRVKNETVFIFANGFHIIPQPSLSGRIGLVIRNRASFVSLMRLRQKLQQRFQIVRRQHFHAGRHDGQLR